MFLDGLSIFEMLAHTTIRIECDVPGGVSKGTGFFCNFAEGDNLSIPCVVTNKHVVDNSITGRLRVSLLKPDGTPQFDEGLLIPSSGKGFYGAWVPHPDPNIDLCVMPAFLLSQEARARGKQMFMSSVSLDRLPSKADIDDFAGLEKIMMVGYPNGIWDTAHNLPVFRSGTLATHYKHDWQGRSEFLIDCATFPGSSGSPILGVDIGGYYTKSGYKTGLRVHLLGVLRAVFQHQVDGTVEIVPVPTTTHQLVSHSMIPNHLGIAIKAEQLLAFDQFFRDPRYSGWRAPTNQLLSW